MLFAANVLAYRKPLDNLNLSVGYAIMLSGGLVLVTRAASMIPIVTERITWTEVSGMALIGVGVWRGSQGNAAPAG